jgi:hypothetical protein
MATSEVVLYPDTAMPVTERNVSDMIRYSGEVLREAERQDVVLRRRDGLHWPHCDGLKWPHLPSGFLLFVCS